VPAALICATLYLRTILICINLTTNDDREPLMQPLNSHRNEEHDMPSVEAVLACTLALMTGYSQALQAELDPQARLDMGLKIGDNLSMLANHPQLSIGFRQVLLGLQNRWHSMSECTAQAFPANRASGFQMAAPKTLQ
jgi:hypothetical protein